MRAIEYRGPSHERSELPSAVHERLLRILGMTRRPLLLHELQSALGLLTHEASESCRWLADQGYISSMASSEESTHQNMTAPWRLSMRGRLWLKAHHGDCGTARKRR